MKFWKMNGAGNDFIVINNMEEKLPESCFSMLAKTLCERHLSIGADGMMIVEQPQQGGDYRMVFYNSDGSMGEMCGNGARCICRYGYEHGYAPNPEKICVQATAGLVTGRRLTQELYEVRLNDPTVIDLHRKAEALGKEYDCAYIELGDPGLPHAVVLAEEADFEDMDLLREKGRALRRSAARRAHPV